MHVRCATHTRARVHSCQRFAPGITDGGPGRSERRQCARRASAAWICRRTYGCLVGMWQCQWMGRRGSWGGPSGGQNPRRRERTGSGSGCARMGNADGRLKKTEKRSPKRLTPLAVVLLYPTWTKDQRLASMIYQALEQRGMRVIGYVLPRNAAPLVPCPARVPLCRLVSIAIHRRNNRRLATWNLEGGIA